jgi:hypothetical protein
MKSKFVTNERSNAIDSEEKCLKHTPQVEQDLDDRRGQDEISRIYNVLLNKWGSIIAQGKLLGRIVQSY